MVKSTVFWGYVQFDPYCIADFGINSILFQRGIYPPEQFKPVENYGLTILMSQDNKIKEFLSTTLTQLKGKRENLIEMLSSPI